MSGAQKKRMFEKKPENVSSGDSDDSDDGPNNEAYTGNEEIQVEFEGRNPIDSDFHGIKQLLLQLFLKAHINVSELSELIIGQNYVGSVVKQSPDEDGEEDEDDEMSDLNDVFGVTSVINITNKENVECVQQLRNLLVELAEKHATDSTLKLVKEVLSNEAKPAGLLINERFINIPAQIAVPLLENLYTEIQRAINKKMAFDFSYYILICKLYKLDAKKKKKNKNEPEIIWSNPEEEMLLPEAVANFEFSVKDEADTAMGGNWLEGDAEMTPFRKILVFDASSLPRIIETVKNYVNAK